MPPGDKSGISVEECNYFMVSFTSLVCHPLIGDRSVHQVQVIVRDEELERPLQCQERRSVLRPVAPAFAHDLE